MVRLNKTVLVEKIAKSSFKECDLDGTGESAGAIRPLLVLH